MSNLQRRIVLDGPTIEAKHIGGRIHQTPLKWCWQLRTPMPGELQNMA
jgi:hypothetical protein